MCKRVRDRWHIVLKFIIKSMLHPFSCSAGASFTIPFPKNTRAGEFLWLTQEIIDTRQQSFTVDQLRSVVIGFK